jgi:L-threonylcarbamoyladenylate synthase
VTQAAERIRDGGIIIFPTDTAFAISCRIDRPDSVKRLFTLRNRPETKAVPLLVASIDMAKSYFADVSDRMSYLMKTYWPGGLTIVAKNGDASIDPLLLGGGSTVGLRQPSHTTALDLIDAVGVPLVGTSANFSGGQTPYTLFDLNPDLIALTDGVVDGVCTTKIASTVIDCSAEPPVIVRQGAVDVRWEGYTRV